jgi:hypothetical protein
MRTSLLVLLTSITALTAAGAMAVPRGGAIDLDGRMDEAEWRDATVHEASGITLRLRHDGEDLYLGIVAERPGFASVCIAGTDTVDVLHASAALGSIRYARQGADWTTEATRFDFGMRNRELSESARAERRAYLAEHGWVATTFGMGGGTVQELRIGGSRLAEMSAIAVAFFIPEGDSGTVVGWPETLAAGDGCIDERLVRGEVPSRLSFDPSRWASPKRPRTDGVGRGPAPPRP